MQNSGKVVESVWKAKQQALSSSSLCFYWGLWFRIRLSGVSGQGNQKLIPSAGKLKALYSQCRNKMMRPPTISRAVWKGDTVEGCATRIGGRSPIRANTTCLAADYKLQSIQPWISRENYRASIWGYRIDYFPRLLISCKSDDCLMSTKDCRIQATLLLQRSLPLSGRKHLNT